MDIYEFINSKDVREHCRKIGHEFNSIETAFLIYQSQNHTIQQKHDAWGEIIETFPDMPIAERLNCPHYDSLHDMLKQYMTLESRILSDFSIDESNCFHSCWTLYYTETDRLCQHEFDLVNILTDEEIDLFYSLDGLWIDVPTPFRKGDIVFENREKIGFPREPFVLTELCTDKETENEKKIFERVKKQGDSSDMIAYGYWFLPDQNKLYYECIHNYLNLEYYTGELTDGYQVLNEISCKVKDGIEIQF